MSTIAAQHMFRPQIKHLEINAGTLAVYEWPKPQTKPKAYIVMVHGLGEHMGRYNHVAFALNHAGYAVTGYDHVGHGLSTGARGDIKDAQQLVNDLEQVLHAIKPDHEGLATVLLGHSMGGLVVARTLADLDARPGVAAGSPTGRDVEFPGTERAGAARGGVEAVDPQCERITGQCAVAGECGTRGQRSDQASATQGRQQRESTFGHW